MPGYFQDIWATRKVNRGCYEQMMSKTCIRKTNPKKSKKYKETTISERLVIVTTICYNNDTTQVYRKNVQMRQQIYKTLG